MNQNQEIQEDLSLANPFLSKIPEEDRPYVEKYIKEWDSGVTKKFQEYSTKLKGYEELGDISTLANAHSILEGMQEDPVGFFNYFKDYLISNADSIQEQYKIANLFEALGMDAPEMTDPNENDLGGLPEFEGVPPQLIEMINELKGTVGELSENFTETKSSLEEREQMEMFDSLLEDMHNEHGDFDDTYVLTLIAAGTSPEDAIQGYNDFRQSIIDNHRQNPPPPIIGGPGGTPLDQVDATKLLDAKSRKELGAAILQRGLHN